MLQYVRISAKQALPRIEGLRPYKAVLVAEEVVAPDRQHAISKWLVDTGCLYMLAWGPGSSSWDDSVDHANQEHFDYGDIPDDSFVMTSWHEDESLEEVFLFAKRHATHPTQELPNTLIVHLGDKDMEAALRAAHDNA